MKKIEYYVIKHEYYDYGSYVQECVICKSEDLSVIERCLNNITNYIESEVNSYKILNKSKDNLKYTGSNNDRYEYHYYISKQSDLRLYNSDSFYEERVEEILWGIYI